MKPITTFEEAVAYFSRRGLKLDGKSHTEVVYPDGKKEKVDADAVAGLKSVITKLGGKIVTRDEYYTVQEVLDAFPKNLVDPRLRLWAFLYFTTSANDVADALNIKRASFKEQYFLVQPANIGMSRIFRLMSVMKLPMDYVFVPGHVPTEQNLVDWLDYSLSGETVATETEDETAETETEEVEEEVATAEAEETSDETTEEEEPVQAAAEETVEDEVDDELKEEIAEDTAIEAAEEIATAADEKEEAEETADEEEEAVETAEAETTEPPLPEFDGDTDVISEDDSIDTDVIDDDFEDVDSVMNFHGMDEGDQAPIDAVA